MRTKNDPLDERLRQAFLGCLRGTPKNLEFSTNALLSKWFRAQGSPYYFLFRKNLSQTNIQFAELISLLRLHTHNTTTHHSQKDLQFVMVGDFLKGVQAIVEDLLRSKPEKRALSDAFLDLYAVMKNTVLLDVFHGSCVSYFPPHLKLDLMRCCGESGYIHSCGNCILAEDLAVSDDSNFKKTVSEYLVAHFQGQPFFFVVYSHEDFSKYDRDVASELRGGLDEVKLSAEKYFIGDRPLVRVLQELESTNRARLVIAQAGDYRLHPAQRTARNADKERTIWLMIDKMVDKGTCSATRQQVLICYDQLYKNNNPLHLFDENKPGWVAHTTIPHTLASAMLNITRPGWPATQAKIYDPFSGTGTIAIEALKFPNAHVTCNDNSPIARILLDDNLDFFGCSLPELKKVAEDLGAMRDMEVVPVSHLTYPSPYTWAINLFDELAQDGGSSGEWFDIPESIVRQLDEAPPKNRLRFYVALRTKLRHASAFDRNSTQWTAAYREEVNVLLAQIQRLCKLRGQTDKAGNHAVALSFGDYSLECSIDTSVFTTAHRRRITTTMQDARVAQRKKFDVILTDPPYGFNNEIQALQLAKLLTDSLDVLLEQLKPRGQLVVAIPDMSHSGKRIPLFATRTWMTQQVLAKAEAKGFETVMPATVLPSFARLFSAPYYWHSERALTRSILHFQFQRKKHPLVKRARVRT